MSLTKVSYSLISGAYVNALDYGAVGDGTTDDTAALQAALDATPRGSTLYIPSGKYLVSDTITAPYPMTIRGEGWSNTSDEGTWILAKSTMSNTTDVFVLSSGPASSDAAENYNVFDLRISPATTKCARHGLRLRGEDDTGPGINKATVERVRIDEFNSYGFRNAGAFSSTVQNCFITGLLFDSCTDNQNVLNNTLFGHLWGVYINAVVGTNMFNIVGNVVVNRDGGVYAQNVGTLTIADNQFEAQQVTTAPQNSMIYLEGEDWFIYNTQITGNSFNVSPDYIQTTIYCNKTVNTYIAGNRFSGGLPYPDTILIYMTGYAINTIVGQNFVFSTNTGQAEFSFTQQAMQYYDATYAPEGRIFGDYAYSTCGLWKPLTLSSGVTRNANYNNLGCIKTYNQQIILRGGVDVTSAGAGKQIATIPEGYRPPVDYNTFPVACRDSSNNYYTAWVRITSTGGVILANVPAGMPSTVEVSLEGITFYFYY